MLFYLHYMSDGTRTHVDDAKLSHTIKFKKAFAINKTYLTQALYTPKNKTFNTILLLPYY